MFLFSQRKVNEKHDSNDNITYSYIFKNYLSFLKPINSGMNRGIAMKA